MKVTIHDARGRLVRPIELPGLSSSGSGGFRQVTWNGRVEAGRFVPSGVYFMAIRGQGLSDAKRIVVLR
jgi:flagellar hook assembly protein FlgD